jgi:Zn-dependent peptidase ImmA (M78 family)/transcriptional regulator with XRE-family HTH domain
VSADVGIGESTLSELELGKRPPSLSQLSILADRYRKPLAFFFETEEPAMEVVLWRQRPAKGAEEYESEFVLDCKHYRNLEAWCKEETSCSLPSVEKEPSNASWAWVEDLAVTTRNNLRLGDRPALTLLQTLEETCYVKVFHREFEPTGTAASSLHASFGAGILLNAKNPQGRRNYDLAHELFHLITWKIFRPQSLTTTEQEEKFADKFASVLLMPEETVKASVARRSQSVTLSSVADIAREFAVSIPALLWRMHWVFRWNSRDDTKALIERAEAHAKALEGVLVEESRPPSRPPRFYALAVKALRAGDMSVGRFAEYLGISRKQAMSYIEEEVSEDEAIQLSPP